MLFFGPQRSVACEEGLEEAGRPRTLPSRHEAKPSASRLLRGARTLQANCSRVSTQWSNGWKSVFFNKHKATESFNYFLFFKEVSSTQWDFMLFVCPTKCQATKSWWGPERTPHKAHPHPRASSPPPWAATIIKNKKKKNGRQKPIKNGPLFEKIQIKRKTHLLNRPSSSQVPTPEAPCGPATRSARSRDSCYFGTAPVASQKDEAA